MRLLVWFCFALALFSCNKLIPAGFWKNFEKAQLIESVGDQGPWGGHCAIYWNTNKGGYFNTEKVIEFAKKKWMEAIR